MRADLYSIAANESQFCNGKRQTAASNASPRMYLNENSGLELC